MARLPTTDWIDAGWAHAVRNRDQLLRTIGRISTLHAGRVYAWRGQSNAAWGLSSSLHRELVDSGSVSEARMRSAELHIVKRAREYGLGRELGPSNTDANLLATLQHHGVPTRLFDVTSNPMTALWFACQQPTNGRRTSGVLFAIDVTETRWMVSAEFGPATWGGVKDPLGAAYETELEASRSDQRPFRLYPALPDERMKAQEGYFLVSAVPSSPAIPHVPDLAFPTSAAPGGSVLRQLVEVADRGPGRPPKVPLLALVIPPDVKDALRGPLRGTYNRRRRVLFPDVDGFRSAFEYGEETPEAGPTQSTTDPRSSGSPA